MPSSLSLVVRGDGTAMSQVSQAALPALASALASEVAQPLWTGGAGAAQTLGLTPYGP